MTGSDAHVYAAAGGNVYVFAADEQRWQRLNAQRVSESELRALAVSGKCFCGVAGRADLFHSTDGGQSWLATVLPVPQTDAASGHSHAAGPPAASLSAPTILTVAAKGNYVYASTAQGQFVSTDCGGHWTPIPAAFLPRAYAFSGDHLYAASDAGVHLSTDHGRTWSSLTSNLDQEARVIALSGRLMLVATGGGVFADYRAEGAVAGVSAASYEADAEQRTHRPV